MTFSPPNIATLAAALTPNEPSSTSNLTPRISVNISAINSMRLGVVMALWLTCLWTSPAVHADVYRWVEDDGTVNYGEREPRNRDFTVISRSHTPAKSPPPRSSNRRTPRTQPQLAPVAPAAASTPQVADDNLSDHQRAMLDKLKADEARRQESIAEIRKSNCATSKRVLSQMQSRGRIRMRNDAGEESAMTDEDRNERIRQAQESIAVNCDSLS